MISGLQLDQQILTRMDSRPLARAPRMRLWYEHLGWLENNETVNNQSHPMQHGQAGKSSSAQKALSSSDGDYSNIESFDAGFNLWNKIADYNGLSVANSDYIIGHLYYYNFEDMHLPAPYPEAKGGSKFSLL